jgi:hypothetical protein
MPTAATFASLRARLSCRRSLHKGQRRTRIDMQRRGQPQDYWVQPIGLRKQRPVSLQAVCGHSTLPKQTLTPSGPLHWRRPRLVWQRLVLQPPLLGLHLGSGRQDVGWGFDSPRFVPDAPFYYGGYWHGGYAKPSYVGRASPGGSSSAPCGQEGSHASATTAVPRNFDVYGRWASPLTLKCNGQEWLRGSKEYSITLSEIRFQAKPR